MYQHSFDRTSRSHIAYVKQPGIAPGFFVARHIHASSHASSDLRSEDCDVCSMMRPVVLPANGFATAETSTAVQKVLARRAQVESAAPASSAHRSFPGSRCAVELPCRTRLKKRCLANHLST